jgi:transcriptional regulator with XRE-family HTH domain
LVTILRLLRVQTGETLRAFAKHHGFNEVLLTRIELGQSYVPPAIRVRLATSLGVAPEMILDPKTGWPALAGKDVRLTIGGAGDGR